jgi:hypothetical protein
MKDKSTILAEHSEGAIFAEGLVYDGFTDAIYAAMDQYSEQISIGFIEWIANNRIYRHEIAKGVWNWEVIKETTPGVFTAFPEYDHYSTAELFNLYKQTLK